MLKAITAFLLYVSGSTRIGLLGSAQRNRLRRGEFQFHFARLRKPHAITHNVRVKAVTAVLVAQPFGQAMARFRTGQMRLAGNVAQIAFGVRRVRNRAQLLLALHFRLDMRGRKASDAVIFLRADRKRGWKHNAAATISAAPARHIDEVILTSLRNCKFYNSGAPAASRRAHDTPRALDVL